MADRVGEQFGEYRLDRKLGGGTFGDVYLGEHTRDNTLAAVKVLQAKLTHPEDLKDFINEIRTLFRLQHPNIVPLLDFGIEGNAPFLIMAYAPHGTLRQPRGTQLPLDTIVTYIRQVAEALQCAHDRRLIHRDVKPDNILLGENEQVWLSDFGITTIAQSSRSLNTQDSAGTISYMAPEQIQGKARPASDQYALGVIAYEWICGARPFNGTAIEVVFQHAQATPPSMLEKVPMLSPSVEQVVMKALEKDYEKRYGNVREFGEALAAAVEEVQPTLRKSRKQLPPTLYPTLAQLPTRRMPSPKKTSKQWFEEGNAHNEAGRYREAIEAYNQAIALDSQDIFIYVNRGLAYQNFGQNERAIEDYDRAIELDPQFAVIYYNRGGAYSDLRQYEQAIEDYDMAIELDPQNVEFYGERGRAFYNLGDYRNAIQDFDDALRLNPGIDWIQAGRDDAYRRLGRK